MLHLLPFMPDLLQFNTAFFTIYAGCDTIYNIIYYELSIFLQLLNLLGLNFLFITN